MSDERFDQDLRSVLREDAPRDVPEDLRRRVAAVSATDTAVLHPPRSAWRRPVLAGAALLAAAVVVLAVGLVPFGRPPGGIGTDPSPTPSLPSSSIPSPSASSSASPSASAGAADGTCLAADLEGRILGWQGAAGSRIAEVEITNRAPGPCRIQGTPRLELVDANGRVLIDSTTAGPSGAPHVAPTDPTFELAPNDRLTTEVQASNYCGPAPSTPIDIAITLTAGGGRLLATPDTGVSSAEAVPPCLGSAATAEIAMNGWRR